jgi:peptidyl-dipeptidase A
VTGFQKAWWALRQKYQGIAAPVARSEADFDPGAKYHILGNTPYTRYFLAFSLQFQFHKALCDAAGHKGPLPECSVYGNAEAGPILAYFEPLMGWLQTRNTSQQCGWEGEG